MIRSTRSRVHVRRVSEVFRPDGPGYFTHPEWEERFPWLAQGTTGEGAEGENAALDFALFTDLPAESGRKSWHTLGLGLGFPRMVHSRQVHGRKILIHRGGAGASEGQEMSIAPDADGHLTRSVGLLMGVTVADCVPVFLVDPERQAIGMVHAGWRSTAAGILEEAISLLADELEATPGNLHLHLGPAICGACYEVGPEVHRALGLPDPGGPKPVDVRNCLAVQGTSLGIHESRITESSWCTRCEGSPFFSHRRGESGRQVGFLGIRPSEVLPGLCGTCEKVRVVRNRRGSDFFLCSRSKEDPKYPKYPRLPVSDCPGYREGEPGKN